MLVITGDKAICVEGFALFRKQRPILWNGHNKLPVYDVYSYVLKHQRSQTVKTFFFSVLINFKPFNSHTLPRKQLMVILSGKTIPFQITFNLVI